MCVLSRLWFYFLGIYCEIIHSFVFMERFGHSETESRECILKTMLSVHDIVCIVCMYVCVTIHAL